VTAYHPDTICAVATPPGRGGIGIIRISGAKSQEIGTKILQYQLKPRYASYCDFHVLNEVLDQGIALFFQSPNSFTGEDVLELHGHGGPIVMDNLIKEVIRLGARLARPGEFSERAFLNDKLDLTQAEAIADLIEASSQQAAKQALNSLKGQFSAKIAILVDKLIYLRMYVESAIDFPEEEIDFLADGKVNVMLNEIITLTKDTLHQAQQGVLLKEGMKVVIAGRPNAGKSSLLNKLAEQELTNIAGTTRDVLRQHIHIDGLPLHIADTAGLHESTDHVEQIGIERAWKEIDDADRILLVIDSTDANQIAVERHWPQLFQHQKYTDKLTIIFNKIDQSSVKISESTSNLHHIHLSALTGEGIELLKAHLKRVMGLEGTTEGSFSARRRHITALEAAQHCLDNGQEQFLKNSAGELLAEDLKCAQEKLNEITGTFTSDDLLERIFSSFCIGK